MNVERQSPAVSVTNPVEHAPSRPVAAFNLISLLLHDAETLACQQKQNTK